MSWRKFTSKIPENLSALYLSHGGGPLPLLGDSAHEEMVDALSKIAATIKRPSAIIVVSAHWEEKVASITHHAQPPMIYDYYGFSKAAYELQYRAPGDPKLANRIRSAFQRNNIQSQLDGQRGFDHGLYVPLMLMFPEADIPCVQVSLLNSLDASQHIRLGRALSECVESDILLIGSGFSFHNMKAFGAAADTKSTMMNEAFESWLIETCVSKAIDENNRTKRLIDWRTAPHARYCHPREEHLLPLHVCYGAMGRPCSSHLEMSIINKKSSMYLWS